MWASRQQTEIALSTEEAKYIALSTAMRDLLPGRALLKEIEAKFQLSFCKESVILSKVWEDNQDNLVGRSCKQGDILHKAYCRQVSFLLQSLE